MCLVNIQPVHLLNIQPVRTVLSELFDLSLPADCVDLTKTGVKRFAARYGFLEKQVQIRFRILDPGVQAIPGVPCPDIALDADSFSRLELDVRQAFITENETNFLAFPSIKNAIVIFGKGYGWDALGKSRWLDRCEAYYWGDIDTNGFVILDQLREYFPHIVSFLMDSATLHAHTELWGVEDKPKRNDLHHLTREELNLYNDLRDNRIREGLRLEQEHLGFGWVSDKLDCLVGSASKRPEK